MHNNLKPQIYTNWLCSMIRGLLSTTERERWNKIPELHERNIDNYLNSERSTHYSECPVRLSLDYNQPMRFTLSYEYVARFDLWE